jgi:hypothetical protein
MANLIEVLNEVAAAVPGFLSCSVTNRADGTNIGSVTSNSELDMDAVDAYFTHMLVKNDAALTSLGFSDVTEGIMTSTETALFVTRLLGDTPYFWTIATDRGGNLGLSRELMRKFEPAVRTALP